jgi:hypothetical protein
MSSLELHVSEGITPHPSVHTFLIPKSAATPTSENLRHNRYNPMKDPRGWRACDASTRDDCRVGPVDGFRETSCAAAANSPGAGISGARERSLVAADSQSFLARAADRSPKHPEHLSSLAATWAWDSRWVLNQFSRVPSKPDHDTRGVRKKSALHFSEFRWLFGSELQ